MGMWFRKDKTQKWHLACYGGSIAECGRDVHIAAAYATLKTNIDVNDVICNHQYCQACVNSILRGREYIKQLDKEYEQRSKNATVIGTGYKPYIDKDKHEPETISEMIMHTDY